MDKRLFARLLRPPKTSFFLFGARGTGKSTWARQSFPDAHWINLLDEAAYVRMLADPSAFSTEVRAVDRKRWIVLDEIQRIPSLLNGVHLLMEEDRRRFVLLGSSARKLKTAGTNLLAGRAILKEMFPLVPAELGSEFQFRRMLEIGSIPLIWRADDPVAALEAYVGLYLNEEVRGEALVRNLPGFVRFLAVAALYHGQIVNVSGIARDAAVSRTTISGYLEILEDTLVVTRLHAYEAKLRVRERRSPKLYWLDPGIVRAVKGQLGPVTAEERGPLFEGWVHTLLRAYASVDRIFENLYYWAPAEGQVEVDFLLRWGSKFIALEVKASTNPSGNALRGLRAIAELPGLVRRILVYTGEQPRLTADGIHVLPALSLANELAENTLWPD